MTKNKSKDAKAPDKRAQNVSLFEQKRRKIEKLRTWAFVIWVIMFMLIMAKWGKFNLWN